MISEPIVERVTGWAQHEFNVCGAIRIEQIAWWLLREVGPIGDISLSEFEAEAGSVLRGLTPPRWGMPMEIKRIEILAGSKHYQLVKRAWEATAAKMNSLVAAYVSQPVPTAYMDDPQSLPRPDLFLITREDDTIWVECETMTGLPKYKRETTKKIVTFGDTERYKGRDGDLCTNAVFVFPKATETQLEPKVAEGMPLTEFLFL